MTASVFVAPRRWLSDEGSRLDANCFASGGLEAREAITRGEHPWAPLGQLAETFLPPRFARRFIRDQSRGVPFLSSSDVLLADLVGIPCISLRQTAGLSNLIARPRMSLVTRSGTIGRVAFVRAEMEGMAVSEDAIRVVPDEDAVPPGYLFAFLSSRSAQAMIQQRAYGSVVQHIEPQDIADLPVPLPNQAMQDRIHALVEGAATARTEATRLLDESTAFFDTLAGGMSSAHDHARSIGIVHRKNLSGRLDAFHHVGWATEPAFVGNTAIGSIADVSRPAIFRRIWTERGIPFVSGIDAYQLRPTPRERLRSDEAERSNAVIRRGQIFVQRSGQRYGLLGSPAVVTARMDGWAASEDMMRITPEAADAGAWIFSFLRSDSGRRTLLGTPPACCRRFSSTPFGSGSFLRGELSFRGS